jgi:ribonuclease HI
MEQCIDNSQFLLCAFVGKCGAGMVLYDAETNTEVWCGWKYLGADGTNNEAEYNAILLGVQCARSLGVNHLIIEGDSLLAVNQLNGDWRVKESRLKVLYDQIKEELKAYKSCDVRHIRRELNKRADELANQAMDSEGSWGFDESVSS